MKLTFKTIPPAKKNSKQIVYVRGRPIIVSSSRHKQWYNNMMQVIKVDKKFEVCRICCYFFPPNKRRFDLSNSFESISDFLVDVGILKDDSAFYLTAIELQLGGIDKENPRVEVEIYE